MSQNLSLKSNSSRPWLRWVLPSKMGGRVERVISAQRPLRELDDSALRKQSLATRYEAQSGVPLDRLWPQAFALVREAARRALGMEHYPVQLQAGWEIHRGAIAVMQTGEGKTLTATLPLYLHSLLGLGAHLITANDYLAARDAQLMAPCFELLGQSVGTIVSDSDRPARQQAYACDVTYTTAKEIGFDFLRDRLLRRNQQRTGESLKPASQGSEMNSPRLAPVSGCCATEPVAGPD